MEYNCCLVKSNSWMMFWLNLYCVSRWRSHDRCFVEGQVRFDQLASVAHSGTMHYAEMPQDVSCESLSAYKAVGEDSLSLRFKLKLSEDGSDDLAQKKKDLKLGTGKSPDKSRNKHSFRNLTGLNRSPLAKEHIKKTSAPDALCGVMYSKTNFDDSG